MWNRTGTVNVTQNDPSIVGVNTLWKDIVSPGDIFIGPDNAMYEVTAVISDTELAIKSLDNQAKYLGGTVSGAAYAIISNFTYTTNAALAERLSALLVKWHKHEDERLAWEQGTVDGGPNGDGTYPMTDLLGVVNYFTCPAQIAERSVRIDVPRVVSAGYASEAVALTDQEVVTPDLTTSNVFTWSCAGDRTLGNPTIPGAGTWCIYTTVDAAGGRTLALDTSYNLVAGFFDGSANAVNIMLLMSDGEQIDVVICQRT